MHHTILGVSNWFAEIFRDGEMCNNDYSIITVIPGKTDFVVEMSVEVQEVGPWAVGDLHILHREDQHLELENLLLFGNTKKKKTNL